MGVSTIANNIIAYNEGRACAGKLPTSHGGNDVSDLGCELANQKKTNDISEDPSLEKEAPEVPKLADNGGPTDTIGFNTSQRAVPEHTDRGGRRPEAGTLTESGQWRLWRPRRLSRW
ncbi:MAG: hypothetical protein ABSH36_02200 [Solirubrobacteraceae bacterium]